jgi:cation:H+ antiporter
VQWVAPFLSEFPEKLSAFYWARKVSTANVALMNMVSSNINQWSILAAMIPIVFAISAGEPRALSFDQHQRDEILLTILQSLLGFLLLLNLQLKLHESLILFGFWFIQFVVPSWRGPMIYVYLGWCILELVRMIASRSAPAAWRGLRNTLAARFA